MFLRRSSNEYNITLILFFLFLFLFICVCVRVQRNNPLFSVVVFHELSVLCAAKMFYCCKFSFSFSFSASHQCYYCSIEAFTSCCEEYTRLMMMTNDQVKSYNNLSISIRNCNQIVKKRE